MSILSTVGNIVSDFVGGRSSGAVSSIQAPRVSFHHLQDQMGKFTQRRFGVRDADKAKEETGDLQGTPVVLYNNVIKKLLAELDS